MKIRSDFIRTKIAQRRAAKRVKEILEFMETAEFKNATSDQRDAVYTILVFYMSLFRDKDKKGATHVTV